MAHVLLHLTAVERLAAEPGALPAEVAAALAEDVEYARFGAALPDLPRFGNPPLAVVRSAFHLAGEDAPFAPRFHDVAPVAFGLKMAELVASGALVGRNPGLAVLTGWFMHLALDRALAPVADAFARRAHKQGEPMERSRQRVEWQQALLWMRATAGRDLVGERAFAQKTRLLKRRGMPVLGVGGGIYELVRLSSIEAIREAPPKREVDRWVRGLYLYGRALSSPLARRVRPPADAAALEARVYRAPGLDFGAEVEAALATARALVTRVHAFVHKGDFSPRARGRFLADVPEGSMFARLKLAV